MCRENTIICRSNMDTEAFGTVIELSDFIKQASVHLQVDCNFIDTILSLISEIQGELTKRKKEIQVIILSRLGKLVEKDDFIWD